MIVKGVASLFSLEARQSLRDYLNIILNDEYDYSKEELVDLYEKITDEFPYEYGANGEPLLTAKIFESILDVFYKNKLPI